MRTARIALIFLTSLVLATACATHPATGPAGPPPAGWHAYSGAGVSMNVPDSWHANQDGRTGRLMLDGPGGSQAFVWPVFLPKATALRDPESLVRGLTRRAWRDVTWGDLQMVQQPRSLLLSGDDRRDGVTTTALVGWTPTAKGTAVVVYAIRARTGAYEPFATIAQEAFASVRLHGTAGAPGRNEAGTPPARPALQWTRFVDPRERAFSADVPQGWSSQGGLFRFGAVDVRFGLETRSPDGGIMVRFGDPNIGTFVTGAIGYGEGATFSPGYGQMMTVRQYVPPAQFAVEYASQRPECSGDFQPTAAQPRPDLTSAMNDIYGRFGLAVRLDAGDVSFTCGGGWRGYWLAVLQIVQMGGPAMWKPEYLLGYLARPSDQAEAQAVLTHLISSIRVDPQWYQRQTGQAASTAQVVSQTGAAIAHMVNQGYRERHENDRAMSIKESNAMLGVEQVEDPVTGERYDVELGSKYHWINARGTIVGTQTDALPDMQMRLMARVKPGQ